MRKILSLVLVLALVLGAFPAFAADNLSEAEVANKLKEYKVLIGNESGDLMLDEKLTREQALVILARFMGVEEEAKNTTLDSSFKDVDHPYYEPFIAYAELKGWTNGMGNDMFGYGQNVTVQHFAAFMLRALGYDVPYEGVMETAKEVGILPEALTTAGSVEILRGQTAVVMYMTLNTKPANSEMTLLQQLGLEDKAPTGVAGIQKVEASNLKQLKVYFTAPLEKAGDEDNWSVNKDANFKITKDAKFELSEDKMMVTITFADGEVAKQQEVVSLTCKDLLGDSVTIEDIQFLDVTIPVVEKVEVIGINTLKVTFSEPMTNASLTDKNHYSVKKANGTKLYVNEVKAQNYGMVALVELYSDLSEGDITVEIKDVEDFQDYNVKEPAIFNLTVVKDTEKPYITGFKEASPYEVTLIWNEDIKFVDNPVDLDKFYHTNTEDTPYKVTIDGNEMKLEFKKDDGYDHLLPQGVAYVYVKKGAVQDYWENQNDSLMHVTEIELDKEAPSIVKYKQTKQNELKFTFSENIYNKGDYKIKLLKDGKEDSTGFSYMFEDDADHGKVLIVKFDKNMFGDYSLVFENVQDRAGNKMAKTTYDVNFVDKTQPVADDFKVTAYNVGEKMQKILIDFGEKMDVDSIKDRDNYWLIVPADIAGSYTVVDNLNKDDVEFEVLENGEKLLITLPKEVFELTGTGEFIDQQLKIGRLKDAAGNKMTTFTAVLDIVNGENAKIETTAKLTSKNTVVVTIKDDVRAKLQLDKIVLGTSTNGSVFSEMDNKKYASTNVELKGGKTVITIKLNKDQALDTTNPAAVGLAFKVNANEMVNKYGKQVKVMDWTAVTDSAAPEVAQVYFAAGYTTDGAIIVEFTEKIVKDSVAKYGDNGFNAGDKLIPTDVAEAVKVMGKYIVLTENDDKKNFSANTDVSYDGKNNLQDAAGNRVKEFTRTKNLKTTDLPF